MKKAIFVFIFLVSWPGLIFTAGNAQATASSYSKARIDWNTFTYSYTGTGLTWDWKESYSEYDVFNDSDFDFNDDSADGWVNTSAEGSVANATAKARTGDDPGTSSPVEDELYVEVSATAGGPDSWADAYANASRYGAFTTSGAGTLTISVMYYLDQELSTELPGEVAEGWSYAYLDLYNWDDDELVVDDDEYYEYRSEVGSNGPLSKSDTLTVSLWFEGNQDGDFFVDVVSGAYAAPEPATMLLLGAGLIGLAGFRRKIKR